MLLQSETPTLDDPIPEPSGVRDAGGISLGGCQLNRVHARQPKAKHPSVPFCTSSACRSRHVPFSEPYQQCNGRYGKLRDTMKHGGCSRPINKICCKFICSPLTFSQPIVRRREAWQRRTNQVAQYRRGPTSAVMHPSCGVYFFGAPT
jgi:hypothetical protein